MVGGIANAVPFPGAPFAFLGPLPDCGAAVVVPFPGGPFLGPPPGV